MRAMALGTGDVFPLSSARAQPEFEITAYSTLDAAVAAAYGWDAGMSGNRPCESWGASEPLALFSVERSPGFGVLGNATPEMGR